MHGARILFPGLVEQTFRHPVIALLHSLQLLVALIDEAHLEVFKVL